jgi:Mrp family chromosome partitioning ATPase
LLVPTRKGANAQPIDAVIKRTASGYSEALRGLLTSVKLAGQNGALRVLLVTSVKAGDGKTTIAAGLARTSALQGVPTVLVDCDVRGRGGSLARDLKIDDPGPGLIAVLKGEVQLADALRRDEESGVMVLPMSEGATPSDDLMGGIAMDALLASLRRAYGAVILDAPPIPIAVARVLAAKADATILVAAWRARAADGLRAALRLQPFDQPGQVGVVLNRIDVALQSRYGFGQDVTLQARYGVGQSGDREKKSSHHYA